jgi:hypothetical protein
VEGRHDPVEKSVRIVSRSVTEMRATIPPGWMPAALYWNGVWLGNFAAPGCYLLTSDQELLHATPCQE